jgi:NAD(P)-dependent dehydrogenase (short-subunit alcohol dehydrogenase family)
MTKIFITGSADGLGLLAAKALISQGHQVVLHARNAERAGQALAKAPGAADVLTGDLSSMEETRALASKANVLGTFDAVIHNAAVYKIPESRTAEGLPVIFAVNTIAPYILTCLMHKPARLIYLSSDMHLQGNARLDNLKNLTQTRISYSDTKLHDLMLAFAVARKYPGIYSNAVHPGWVPTKMGGPGAPDDLRKGFETQVWLAASNEPEATVSSQYFHHKKQAHYLPAANDMSVQEELLGVCQQITGVDFS